jgi:GH25 family lysozyme M1 (1,4-beta-N-acetylmuramidase)
MFGFDVSSWQLHPKENSKDKGFDWPKVAEQASFFIARATYGIKADTDFHHFAKTVQELRSLPFGAYHFYRQSQSWEDQIAQFRCRLEAIGGLRAGLDLVPTLDLEENNKNGDGWPKPSVFNSSGRAFAEAIRDEYGACIIYMSSFFPEVLGAPKSDKWKWMLEPGYYFWLADYSVSDGLPRTPYTPEWALHQFRVKPHPLYRNGKEPIDVNVVNPQFAFENLIWAG